MRTHHKMLASVVFAAATVLMAPGSAFATTCYAFDGTPVTYLPTTAQTFYATYEWGAPVVRYNAQVLAQLSTATQEFILLHECAHHANGHLADGVVNVAEEQDADCAAINTLMGTNGYSSADLEVLKVEFATITFAGDSTHLPGVVRASNLDACMAVGGTQTNDVPADVYDPYGTYDTYDPYDPYDTYDDSDWLYDYDTVDPYVPTCVSVPVYETVCTYDYYGMCYPTTYLVGTYEQCY